MKRTFSACLLVIFLYGYVGHVVASEAGRVLFARGGVAVQRGAAVIGLTTGAPLQEGDVLRTEADGFMQLRMADGALIALRPGSTLVLEQYRLDREARPANRFGSIPGRGAPALAQAMPAENPGAGRVAMRLLKGGFRTISGAIGRIQRDEYQVTVSTVVLGIRGTDYTVLMCSQDCRLKDGIHARVSQGGIALVNTATGHKIELRQGEYGFFGTGTQRPTVGLSAPDELTVEAPANADDPGTISYDTPIGAGEERTSNKTATWDAASDASANPSTADSSLPVARASAVPMTERQASSGETAALTPAQSSQPSLLTSTPSNLATTTGRSLAFINTRPDGGGLAAARFGSADAGFGADGDLSQLNDGTRIYNRGDAPSRDLGQDDATGLRWGRWASGSAQQGTAAASTVNALHWVAATDGFSDAALPRSGQASYQLVGNTAPTNRNGQTGFVGTATFNADFAAASLSTSVTVGINGSAMQASGTAPLAAQFSGRYDAVTVNNVPQAGGGSFVGFFTGARADAAPAGAALTYSISAGAEDAQGALIFGNPGTTP